MKLPVKLGLPLIFVSSLFAEDSSIRGVVRDQATQQPLIGANIIVEGTIHGAAADVNGEFIITNVPPGFYHVRFEMMGYRPLVKMNVRVNPKRGVFVTAELVQQAVELEGVTVTRAYFQKEKDAFVSSRTVDFEEIRRDPSGYDIQRMMQALPSVVSTADQQNEIVVRGGSPGENLFIMDNIEISNPNQFGMQGTGGGPINIVNTLFIDRVDFLAGAFPAKYYDKTSSVMDIRLKEGNRNFHSWDLDMSMAGFGFFAEGPVAGGKGSYMASYRKSYLDLIIKQTGLTAIPRYWNTQAKVTYDINPTNKLMFNYMYGYDAIDIVGENTPQSRGAENVISRGNQSAMGLTYKRLWKREGLSRFTVAWTDAQYTYDVFRRNGAGVKNTYYEQDETEWDLQMKGDFVWRLSPGLELSGGADIKQLGLDFDAESEQDTVWIYGYSLPTDTNFRMITRSEWESVAFPIIANADLDSVYFDKDDVWHYGRKNSDGSWNFVKVRKLNYDLPYDSWSTKKKDSFYRYGSFLQLKWRPAFRFTMNLGLRVGYHDLTDFSWLSPRLGISYHLSDRSTINMGYGKHFQFPALIVLTSDPENEKLRSKYTNQSILGLEHFFSEDTRGTVEVYWKDYKDIPVTVSSTTADTADQSSIYVNDGEGYSYGIELFLQKKLAKDFFGTFSYTYYRALARDVRYPDEEKYYPWDFDFKNVLTAIGGYKIPIKGPNVKPLEDRNWFARLMGKTIGFGADELELSFRYRYLGGKPYTPKVYNHTVRRWYTNEGADYNTERISPYHRFDIMILWHTRIGKMTLISYFDLQNVFNRDNIWDIQRNSDGTKEDVTQFKVFPIGGFTLEF
ncbi:MAG: TonB-dependent receptor [Candidatus Marinimicrobia bacterium]|nr:TonB-dependent receptor [Candidatus Neomarinimicrobiota bacterium]